MWGLFSGESNPLSTSHRAALFFIILTIFPAFTKLAGTLSVGAGRITGQARVVNTAGTPAEAPREANLSSEFRVELLMALDLFVRAERVLRDESSAFTRSIGRIPDVLGSLTQYYKIEVARATRDQLLVIATGEGSKSLGESFPIIGDRLAIDGDFRINANFPIPDPSRDYLQTLARTVMNRIQSGHFRIPDRRELDAWEGIFRGYFRYEIRPTSVGGRTIVAIGTRTPLTGEVVEMQDGADLYEWVYRHRNSFWAERELYWHLETLYLAERINQEHMGSYASSMARLVPKWASLAALSGELSAAAIQELQLDPTFGFHAEVAPRAPASLGTDRKDDAAGTISNAVRAWSVNGYGQVSEVATVERLVDEFEMTRKKVESHGNVTGAPKSEDFPAAAPSVGRKPLLIDAVEGEK